MRVRSDERKARNEQIRNAFSCALTLEAGPFKLKGRGYEPRTTLKSHIARLLNGLDYLMHLCPKATRYATTILFEL
jgi:hypothetical protein